MKFIPAITSNSNNAILRSKAISKCPHSSAARAFCFCFEDLRQVEVHNSGLEPLHAMPMQLAPAVAKKLLAFVAKEAASDRDNVIALLEDEFARDEAGAPFINFRAALAAVGGDIFLRDAVNHCADSGPHAGAGTHGAGLMRGVQDKVRQIAAVSAANVLKGFQLAVLDAGAGSFDAVSSIGNHHFALAEHAGNHRSDRIVTAVTGTLGLGDSQFHEFLFGLVGVRNHLK